jgi:predicted secreted protein
VTNAALPGGEIRTPRPAPPVPDGGQDVARRPRLLRGLAYGIGMAITFTIVWVILKAILDLSVGLVVLAGAAGWLTGTAVALGAEPGTLRRQRSTVVLAVAVSVGIWFAGTYAAYVTSLAVLPESSLDLFGRMANAPFVDVVGASFLPGGPLELAALAVFAWLGAR